jgi:phosphatidylserine/phosphatidylglycerophosphate/cardiolipin synthase-like enzyme
MNGGPDISGLMAEAYRQRLAKPGDLGAQELASDALEASLQRTLDTAGVAGICAGFTKAVNELADNADRVSLAVTGSGWLGAGVPAVERTLTELLDGAEQEILLTVYSMTPGTGRVWDAIERALDTGVRCTLIANRLGEQHPDLQDKFRGLAARHPGTLRVHDFIGSDDLDVLHAKLVIVDRRSALVGSANLTFHGMVSAHELAVVIRGPAVDLIAGRVDLLLGSGLVRPFPS